MYTATTGHLNSALPLSNPFKLSSYQTASKTSDSLVPALSLLSAGVLNVPSSSDPLPPGASFLLEIHRRREQSATPFQKMKRKERDYLEKYAHPSTSMDLDLPTTKSPAPPQSMTKKERNSLLGEALDQALDLMSED
jgi:hypothetical protein